MIIGLSGVARSGKDTVADRLVTSHGFTKIGFADALKEAMYALDPFVPTLKPYPERLQVVVDDYGWERAKDEHPEIRRLLQRLGTEVGRNLFGEDFWVERLADKVWPLLLSSAAPNRVVVPDCRFPNEAGWITEEAGGEVWRITRPGFTAVNPHSSETALDAWKFDTFITNDKTVAALHEHIDYLVEARLHGREAEEVLGRDGSHDR